MGGLMADGRGEKMPSTSIGSKVVGLIPPLPLATFLVIVRSALPYIAFLFAFASNKFLRILPVADDVGGACITLYNVTMWESCFISFSPHQVISSHHNAVLDVLSAVPYMAHYTIPVIYPVFLHLTNRTEVIPRFYRLLGICMWMSYVIWFFLPTAPPWFYERVSDGTTDPTSSIAVVGSAAVVGSTGQVVLLSKEVILPVARSIVPDHREGAAFARLDLLTGHRFFYNMFAGNPIPFGAFPSGHVAWPTCILITLPPVLRWRFGWYLIWVSWATMYASHHYLSDVIGALCLVLVANKILSWFNTNSRPPIVTYVNGLLPAQRPLLPV